MYAEAGSSRRGTGHSRKTRNLVEDQIMSVSRELLLRLQERLDPHRDAKDWGELCKALLGAPAEDVRAVGDEPVALRAFANDMISAAYEGGSFDGGDIQDIAVKYGLLRIEQRIEACGEHCACSEYGFPAECYRRTDLLKTSQ